MSRRMLAVTIAALTAINLGALAINLSTRSHAAVGGMTAAALAADKDFSDAVKAIVQKCSVRDRLSVSC